MNHPQAKLWEDVIRKSIRYVGDGWSSAVLRHRAEDIIIDSDQSDIPANNNIEEMYKLAEL